MTSSKISRFSIKDNPSISNIYKISWLEKIYGPKIYPYRPPPQNWWSDFFHILYLNYQKSNLIMTFRHLECIFMTISFFESAAEFKGWPSPKTPKWTAGKSKSGRSLYMNVENWCNYRSCYEKLDVPGGEIWVIQITNPYRWIFGTITERVF